MVTMLVTPADAWMAMRIFGEKMVLSALNLRDKDFELLGILRNNPDVAMSADELQMEMPERGFNITTPDVRSSLDNMQYKGYVRKNTDSSHVEYSATPFATKAKRYVDLNWSEVVEQTKKTARKAMPDKIAEQYIERHCQGEGLLVTHPFTGETVNLAEQAANELAAKEAEQVEEQNEMMDETNPFGSGGSSDDDSSGGLGDFQ